MIFGRESHIDTTVVCCSFVGNYYKRNALLLRHVHAGWTVVYGLLNTDETINFVRA